MDFKLGLKLKKVSDKLDVSISKDELVDPVFTTQQTDTMFILTSPLKGYGRRDIKIEINEDGSRITISGEKPVEEMLMVKQVEMRGFQKTFEIPEGVVLDKVKARFDQDESRLVVRMPKSVHGMMMGMGIQELKTTENHVDEEIVGGSDLKQEEEECKPPEVKADNKMASELIEHEKEKSKPEQEEEKEAKAGERSSNIICTPIIAGSALFVSLIVVVFSFIRSKNDSTKKRN